MTGAAPDLTMAAIKMGLALALVLGLMWGAYRIARRKMPYGRHPSEGGLVHVLENRYLGVKKSIALVQVPGAVLVLGIGSDQVNLLDRIDDPNILAGLGTKDRAKTPPNFISFFQRALRGRQNLDLSGGPQGLSSMDAD